jgi:hypothetical protein
VWSDIACGIGVHLLLPQGIAELLGFELSETVLFPKSKAWVAAGYATKLGRAVGPDQAS